jgi:hypothetical protein
MAVRREPDVKRLPTAVTGWLAVLVLMASAAAVNPRDHLTVATVKPQAPTKTTTPKRASSTTSATTAPSRAAAAAHTPPQSIATDCSKPVDREMQAWLDSVPDGATIEFPAGACYGQDVGLILRNRHNLTINGNGVTFRFLADPNATSPLNHRNWTIARGSNVSMTAVVAEGARRDPKDQAGFMTVGRGTPSQQQQAGFFLASLDGGRFTNLVARNNFGDNIHVGPDMTGLLGDFCGAPTPRNIVIDGFDGYNGGRTGVAITVGENIVLQNSRFEFSYDQGIDIETDNASCQPTRDILLANNRWGLSHNGTMVWTGGAGPPLGTRVEVSGNTNPTPLTCVAPMWHWPGNGAAVYTGADRPLYVHHNHLATLGQDRKSVV